MKKAVIPAIALATISMTHPAQAARNTLSASEQVEIAATPDRVWSIVEHFDDLSWHPAVASTELTSGKADQPGAIRMIVTKGGGKITDELVGLKKHSVTYKIVESTLPVDSYLGTLQVIPSKSGSILKWSSTFKRKHEKPNEGEDDNAAKKTIVDIYASGLSAVKARLEKSSK